MIEILDASQQNNNYSSTIQFIINDELIKLCFGILPIDFGHIKRIIEYRPFENTGVAPYKYFFVSSYRKDSTDLDIAFMNIRVEQLNRHKQFEFKISKKYISNLLWFKQLKNKSEILHLIV